MNGKRSAGKTQSRKKPPSELIRRLPLNLKYMPDDNDAVDSVPKSVDLPAILLTPLQLMSQGSTTPERRNPAAETKITEAASTWELAQYRLRVTHDTSRIRSAKSAAWNWSPAKWRDKPRE